MRTFRLILFFTCCACDYVPVPYPFEIFWNIPVEACAEIGEDRLRIQPYSMGFRQNNEGQFFGDEINILYNPGEFPHIELPDEIKNGGLPQTGNLSVHLEKFEKDVKFAIKDPNFGGPAVISFHHWRPSWDLNGWMPRKTYKIISKDYEIQTNKEKSVTGNNVKLNAIIRKKFEDAAKIFFIETLKKAIELRPRALWGYDAYPICFNIKGDLNDLTCKTVATTANDQLKEIYAAGKALYSAAYLSEYIGRGEFVRKHNRSEVIYYRVKEVMRFRNVSNHTYMYVRLHYDDTNKLLSRRDMIDSFRIPCEFGMRGVILWEKSENLDTPAKCRMTLSYLHDVIFAALLSVKPCRQKRLEEKPFRYNL